jgi:SAM-dependent methyltransferase
MNRATILALDAINREFYAAHAPEFSATRESPWPGWERALDPLGDLVSAGPTLRILDVGCGSGRLAGWLEQRLTRPHRYVGLDRSLPMVAIGRGARASSARGWILGDVLATEGRIPCRDAAFDAVLAFGLLHHLPSFRLRRALIADLLRLLRPGGIAALAFWQFGSEPRFERRVLSWERAAGVDPDQLEPGDRLLRWGESKPAAGTQAMRYCHYADPAEAERLTAGLPAEIVDSFRADGRSGTLNLYRVLRRRADAAPMANDARGHR